MTKIDTKKAYSLHILLLKCEGYKFPRNPNSNILEQFCETKFYGPLAVSVNSREPPYELSGFRPSMLSDIESYNKNNNRCQPAPISPTLTTVLPTIVGVKPKMWGAGTQNTLNTLNTLNNQPTLQKEGNLEENIQRMQASLFYMYKYKTAMCPQPNSPHDWNSCLYAHRPSDYRYLYIYIYIYIYLYRRPPDRYFYLPEQCPKFNPER